MEPLAIASSTRLKLGRDYGSIIPPKHPMMPDCVTCHGESKIAIEIIPQTVPQYREQAQINGSNSNLPQADQNC